MNINMKNAFKKLKEAREKNPMLFFEPTEKQKKFIESKHPRILVRAANRVGKTMSLAYKIWKFVLDNPGCLFLVVAADHTSKVQVVGKNLFDLAPKHKLVDSDFNMTRGWKNDLIKLKNGSEIIFRSANSQSTSIAGLTVHAAAIDEPPTEHLFTEVLSRVADNDGPVWITMTPIGRELTWLRKHVEGDPEAGEAPAEEWEQHVITLSAENCPWRTEESIESQKASILPSEYEQRVNAAWEGAEVDRYIKTFTPDHIFDESLTLPSIKGIYLGIDHGELPEKQVAYVVALGEDERLYVLDEYLNPGQTTPMDDAKSIRNILNSWGIQLHQVERAWGDINSVGKMGTGSVNQQLEQSFQQLAGLPQAPFRIRKPSKGPGSVNHGVRLLHQAFLADKILVHERCRKLIKSLNVWRGERNSEFKDPIDALRYVAVELLKKRNLPRKFTWV